ncbi:MAG: HAMP domain-containing protein [Selenomonadaceae bacterium]|uniref:sensor histidine kinase n=1 Tax=Anaerovibrio slackiae TaxID=2652309 RepID=UPI0038661656|nr:HAMP domain-containing protein [Selenomonadaceae bacterium]MBQ5846364.1 HAMP domain-containing protein [Selenomonadaceae bacterium]
MLSKSSRLRFLHRLRLLRLSRMPRMRISVKLTLVYAVLMVVLLFATCAFTAVGIYYTQYHQVERELSFSIFDAVQQLKNRFGSVEEHVTETLPVPPHFKPEEREKERQRQQEKREYMRHDSVKPDAFFGHGAGEAVPNGSDKVIVSRNDLRQNMADNMTFGMVPGVFLKITDAEGDVVYDTDVFSPSLQQLQEHVREQPPLWANPNFQVVEIGNFVIYYKEVPVAINGEHYSLHFFRTITTETRLLGFIQQILLVEMVLGLVLALFLGYFVSQRLLQPIRSMTDTVKSIEVSDLGTRLEVSDTKDELSDLAVTFNRMLERIQQGFDQQQRFVSDASHELRTPVTVIRGYADMLSRWGRHDEETLQEGLEAIGSEAENMQELIEKLLFLARADQKRQILHKELLDMQALVGDVFRKMQMAVDSHHLQLLANEPAMVLADKVTMRQMLRIFLENAVKYTPAGGVIRLSSRCSPDDEGYIELVIEDTGIGIAEEEQEKIFQRFYRVDSSRTKEAGQPGGTGLGLSIAKWIADRHGIKIRVESQPGTGTRFTLKIPLQVVRL